MSAFSEFSLLPELSQVLAELGYEKLTDIQAQSLPVTLKGKDLIGESQTGSGKTTAFALPILQKMKVNIPDTQALILCPTRELATQVGREIRTLGRKLNGLKVQIVFGGQDWREQAQALDQGAHIVVGTPGRVLDLGGRGRLDLSRIEVLVLDEADKMLEMGFAQEMEAILSNLPRGYQSLLFSATMPESILNISRKYQRNPAHIKVAITENPNQIEHFVYETEQSEKLSTLMRVLQQHPAQSTLIFCNQKATADLILLKLKEQGVAAAALHGDLEQRERDQAMALFQNGSLRILVATDIAARGLDVDHLELVINYDLPAQPETYIHRVGRTGRAGKSGQAVTFAKGFDAIQLLEIEKALQIKFQRPTLGFKNQHGLSNQNKSAAMQTISISGGRKHKLRPGDILGALTGETGGFKGSDIGKIEIGEMVSYVAISSSLAQKAIDKLRTGRIKGQKFQVKLIGSK